jgi:hypothetical protein
VVPRDLGRGEPLVEGAELILGNERFVEASRLFDFSEVTPNRVVVNVNAPMPAGAVHVDLPFFQGADRDRYPIRLLHAMGSSGLFEPWRVVEAGAMFWLYDGPGGGYDYWPEGLDGPMHSEYPPFTNSALVADNNRMHHRIGRVGDRAARSPAISVDAEISHLEHGGWVITDHGQAVGHYRSSPPTWPPAAWTCRSPTSPLSDRARLDLVHSTYVTPIDVASGIRPGHVSARPCRGAPVLTATQAAGQS